jgi:RNA-binding protein
MNPLHAKKRSELRARAHSLAPVVIIGDKGLTDEVIAEIDRSLKAHELVKVRAAAGERDARDAWLATICERLQAHAVQQIGKIFVLYRENPKEAVVRKPGPAKPPSGGRRDQDRKPPRSGARRDEARKPPRTGGRGDDARKPPRTGSRGDEARKPPRTVARGDEARKPPRTVARGEDEAKGTSRRRSRTPSPLPESGPRRRPPKTSR